MNIIAIIITNITKHSINGVALF